MKRGRNGPESLFTFAFGVCLFTLTPLSAFSQAEPAPQTPTALLPRLVIVGGGGMPPEVVTKMIEWAGGKEAKSVILPQASQSPKAGQSSVEFLTNAGLVAPRILTLEDPAADLVHLEAASLIWFPGGAQSRLMQALQKAGLLSALRARARGGAVLGGTSAGAAIMSDVMIAADDESARDDSNAPRIDRGLGLWPTAIVDQHFTQRRRLTRLLRATLDHPHLLGVGIDEKTAVFIHGRTLQVLGQGTVTLLDARHFDPNRGDTIAVSVLRTGMTRELPF